MKQFYIESIRGSPKQISKDIKVDIGNEIAFPDEVITKSECIFIKFSYPLINEVIFQFTSKDGFTKKKFWECINQGYNKIFDDEEKAVGKAKRICDINPTSSLINRQATKGPYGIWGYKIGDLWIECVIEIFPNYFELLIGS